MFDDDKDRLRQTIAYKRAEHLRQMDDEYLSHGQIITAVDYSLVAEFVNVSVYRKPNQVMTPGFTGSNMGPKLNWASLVELFNSNYQLLNSSPLLLLPGHLGEVESAWNKSTRAIANNSSEKPKKIETGKNISVEIMSKLSPVTVDADYREIAEEIQSSLREQLTHIRSNEMYSNLLGETLLDLSSLFDGRFGKKISEKLKEKFDCAGQLFSEIARCQSQTRVFRWAQSEGDVLDSLPSPDKAAVLALLVINEFLMPHDIKIVLLTDSMRIHDALDRYKFFYKHEDEIRHHNGLDYCVRDLKIITNRLLHEADGAPNEQRHYWADFILEPATRFAVENRKKFLWYSSPCQINRFGEEIFNSIDYVQHIVNDVEQTQRMYGEEVAKDASMHLVDQFRERDVQVARDAAIAWGKGNWQGLLKLAQLAVSKEILIARKKFIKSSVLRLVARRASEQLEGPLRGRFFTCLFLEDFDRYKISETINRVNVNPSARRELVDRLALAASYDDHNERLNYLKLLGAAILYADLGYWDQAKLLCDEALVGRTEAGGYQGREALFLSAICHRMTVENKEQLAFVKQLLVECQELIEKRNQQLRDETFSGIRIVAEKYSVDSCELAFDVYSGVKALELKDAVNVKIEEVLVTLSSQDECNQEHALDWARFSMRSTFFSLVLLLNWLGETECVARLQARIRVEVLDQQVAVKRYFCSEDMLRVSIRDGLLLMFGAKLSRVSLVEEQWLILLRKQVVQDQVSILKTACYLPYDKKRFKFLMSHLTDG